MHIIGNQLILWETQFIKIEPSSTMRVSPNRSLRSLGGGKENGCTCRVPSSLQPIFGGGGALKDRLYSEEEVAAALLRYIEANEELQVSRFGHSSPRAWSTEAFLRSGLAP